MLLDVQERLSLLGILPEQGNFVTLKLVRELREALSLSEREITDFKVVAKDNLVRWDADAVKNKDVPVGEKMTELIVGILRKLDKEEKLTAQHVPLYVKFVVPTLT